MTKYIPNKKKKQNKQTSTITAAATAKNPCGRDSWLFTKTQASPSVRDIEEYMLKTHFLVPCMKPAI